MKSLKEMDEESESFGVKHLAVRDARYRHEHKGFLVSQSDRDGWIMKEWHNGDQIVGVIGNSLMDDVAIRKDAINRRDYENTIFQDGDACGQKTGLVVRGYQTNLHQVARESRWETQGNSRHDRGKWQRAFAVVIVAGAEELHVGVWTFSDRGLFGLW